jgi:uncharacterized protein YndB with AHSA1/START domain
MVAQGPASGAAPEDWQVVVTRVFAAPRSLVFDAWADPQALTAWWGPKGHTLRVIRLDFRPGGVFHYATRSPAGQELWGRFVYREIVAPERIVFVSSFTDEAGNPVRSPFSPTWPLDVLNTLTLAERDGETTLTLRAVAHDATTAERETFEAGRDSLRRGFGGTLDQLAEYLARAVASAPPRAT